MTFNKSEIKDEFMLVKTKTGKYLHPIHKSHAVYFESHVENPVKSISCLEHPTRVSLPDRREIKEMPKCIACAMAIVYGQTREERPDAKEE